MSAAEILAGTADPTHRAAVCAWDAATLTFGRAPRSRDFADVLDLARQHLTLGSWGGRSQGLVVHVSCAHNPKILRIWRTTEMSFRHTCHMSQTASLREIAESSNVPPDDVIEAVLERIATSDDRTQFLRGLTQRFYAVSAEPSDHNVFEINRWVGSWMLSLQLLDDPKFVAADDEASKLLAAGQLDGGLTGSQLRARYGR